jgi:hypothetical protein
MREAWLQPSVLTSSLQVLVLDEADLLLSYGYAEDLQVSVAVQWEYWFCGSGMGILGFVCIRMRQVMYHHVKCDATCK